MLLKDNINNGFLTSFHIQLVFKIYFHEHYFYMKICRQITKSNFISAISLICCYGFTLSSPVFPRELMTCAVVFQLCQFKDVRAHCYCASLVRTLYMTWRVPRHVFQARAPSRNSTKYRADDLCGNLICEYFCWMLGAPHFFFGRSLPFLILSIILKKTKKVCAWEVLIISRILFQ